MAEISAALVKELRDQTGAPMMDCKRALQEANGDMEAAVRILREKGMAGAAKRSDRATPEGKVGYRLADDNKRGTMVAVGCETEPVSNNDEFLAFAKKVLERVEADGPGAEQDRRAPAGPRGIPGPGAQGRDAHRCAEAELDRPRRRSGRDGHPGARDLLELRRGAGKARTGARQDRGRHAQQALLRRQRARRSGLDPRLVQESRRRVGGRGRRGARIRTLRAERVTVQSKETGAAPSETASVFRRILLKLSGEALMGDRDYGLDRHTVDAVSEDIIEVQTTGGELAAADGTG